MKSRLAVACAFLVGITLSGGAVVAGQMTIPERLAQVGHSLTSSTTVLSEKPPSLDAVLADTDVVIRGRTGQPRSYLSEDKREVLTDFALTDVTWLFDSKPQAHRSPGVTPPPVVTVLGGAITINGLTYTSIHDALPLLEPGTEYVFLLKRSGARLLVAYQYFGVFAVRADGIEPVVRTPNFAPELHGVALASATQRLVAGRMSQR